MSPSLKNSKLSSLLPGAVSLAGATGLVNVLGYVLTLVAARVLVPQDFGAFAALLSLIIIGNVAALAVQAVIARAAATGTSWDARAGLLWGLAVGLLTVALSPLIRQALRLDSSLPVVAVAVAVAALAATAGPIGAVQGRERSGALALLMVTQGTLRVTGGIVGLLTTRSVEGAVGGLAAGLVLAALLAWIAVRPPRPSHGGLRVREVTAAATVLLGFVALTNADVIVARAVLDPVESGAYGAGAVISKVAFWLPQFVPLVAYARLSRHEHRAVAVRWSLLTVAVLGAVTVGITFAAPDAILRVIAGARYLELAPILWLFALLGALMALAQVTVYAALARRDRLTTVLVWVALVALVALAGTAATVTQVVSRASLVALVLVLVTGIRELRRSRTMTSAGVEELPTGLA